MNPKFVREKRLIPTYITKLVTLLDPPSKERIYREKELN